jgi:hypothetical protein
MKQKYNDEFRKMIVELYRSRRAVSELCTEYGIPDSNDLSKKAIQLPPQGMRRRELNRLRIRIIEMSYLPSRLSDFSSAICSK